LHIRPKYRPIDKLFGFPFPRLLLELSLLPCSTCPRHLPPQTQNALFIPVGSVRGNVSHVLVHLLNSSAGSLSRFLRTFAGVSPYFITPPVLSVLPFTPKVSHPLTCQSPFFFSPMFEISALCTKFFWSLSCLPEIPPYLFLPPDSALPLLRLTSPLLIRLLYALFFFMARSRHSSPRCFYHSSTTFLPCFFRCFSSSASVPEVEESFALRLSPSSTLGN